MPYLFRSAVLLLLALGYVALPVLAAGAKKEDPQMEPRLLPWNLRDHYTFSPEGYDFIYGGDNGQWSLEKKGLGFLMDKVNASITFADGKTVEAALHGVGTTVRQKHTAELGPGIEYIVNIPAKDGFSLRHSLAYHNEHPFYLVRLALKNEGTTPLEVSQISSVIIPPGSLKQLGSNATVTHRRVLMHGKSPVYSKDVEPHATFINDPANGLVLGLGSIATGQCKTIVDLQPFSGAWQGSVTSTFDPPVRVEPGQSLQGDPVWISFTTLTQADVDLFFAHALKDYPKYAKADDAPHSWVTVPDGGSFSELQSAIGDWSGVAAALVPVTWESRGGSLDGATPAWPREMRGVASQLRQNGRAGITVDPLAVANGNDAWAAKSEDGQMWLNPATEEGMANGVAQMKKVAAWG
ncbi:MAG TPA: hypothetical protein PK869_11830, partial [Candidatus Hydrogenedentes bacterium]|nr:hypothetical protein [Candidatus Hydrogenedentota bacterium]